MLDINCWILANNCHPNIMPGHGQALKPKLDIKIVS